MATGGSAKDKSKAAAGEAGASTVTEPSQLGAQEEAIAAAAEAVVKAQEDAERAVAAAVAGMAR